MVMVLVGVALTVSAAISSLAYRVGGTHPPPFLLSKVRTAKYKPREGWGSKPIFPSAKPRGKSFG